MYEGRPFRTMEPTIKIALVGAGMFGGDVHLRAYADLQREIDHASHAERPSPDANAVAIATEQAVRSGTMTNDFEPSVFARHPRLLSMKEQLLRACAESALMTGSGAALFGLFRDMTRAVAARDHFAKQEGLLTFLS